MPYKQKKLGVHVYIYIQIVQNSQLQALLILTLETASNSLE